MADKDTLGGLLRKPVKRAVAWLARANPQSYPEGATRILVIREGGYGDLILTMPVIRSLRQHVGSNIMIDLLVREPVAHLMADNGVTGNLYGKGPKLFRAYSTIRAMRRRNYQVIVDLVSSPSLSFALWIWMIAPHAHRLGGDKAELQQMYHQHIDLPFRSEIHFMERLRRIMALATNNAPVQDQIPWFDWPKTVRAQADAVWKSVVATGHSRNPDAPVVLVNLSAGLPRRTWPNESYRSLLSELVPRYRHIIQRWVMTSSPDDHDRAVSLAESLNRPEIQLLPLQSDFRVLCQLTSKFDLVLTPDTSFVHAASAAGVPVVAFTVAENVISWAPWKIPCEVVAAPKGEPVSAIPVGAVAAAFDRMMTKLTVGNPAHSRQPTTS
jgi:heptosyltransferase-3